eukprot:gene22709-40285_t
MRWSSADAAARSGDADAGGGIVLHAAARRALPPGTVVERNPRYWRHAAQDGGEGGLGVARDFLPGTHLVRWRGGAQYYYCYGAYSDWGVRPAPEGAAWAAEEGDADFAGGEPFILPRRPGSGWWAATLRLRPSAAEPAPAAA